MQTIRVLHCNTSADDGWTADSPDLKGWSVAGASYAETKTLAEDAVRTQLSGDGAEVQITHHIACSR
jgi:predicted RNase H-like HicB family nuclease